MRMIRKMMVSAQVLVNNIFTLLILQLPAFGGDVSQYSIGKLCSFLCFFASPA